MRVDLHIHTTASDGHWNPLELIGEVTKAGVQLFAITDHDSVANVEETALLAKKAGLHFIRGVELSTKIDGHVCHILGYGIDIKNPQILKLCKENSARYVELNRGQVAGLKQKGLNVDLDDYSEYSKGKNPSGILIANYLLMKGNFKTFDEALQFIIRSVDWDAPDFPSPREAIQAIKAAGGYAVQAHPGNTLMDSAFSYKELDGMIAMGIEGLECYTNYHDEKTTEFYLQYCRERNLLITAGSDYHGPELKKRLLGRPEVYLEDINLKGIWPALKG